MNSHVQNKIAYRHTCVKLDCKYRRALFGCHRLQRCFRIGCVIQKKKRERGEREREERITQISELFVGRCYCEQTISNEKKCKTFPAFDIFKGSIDRSIVVSLGIRLPEMTLASNDPWLKSTKCKEKLDVRSVTQKKKENTEVFLR